MPNPQFIEQKALSLAEVKSILREIESRDKELNSISNKTKDYLEHFISTSSEQKEVMARKLANLSITRLKDEQIAKIIDFMPSSLNELKAVLASYPNLSLSKKDQENLVEAVKEGIKEKPK